LSLFHFFPLIMAKTMPILLAAFAGLISESSGVINFALEGMMLMGAFGAVWATIASGSPWVGLLGGAAGGLLVGLIHAAASVYLRAHQIVSSIALNLLSAGLSGMLLNEVLGAYGTSPRAESLPTIGGCLTSMGLMTSSEGPSGEAASLSLFVPMALCLTVLITIFLRHTVWGLRLRACGENPAAAEAAGLSVSGIRLVAVALSGILAGWGGACLSIGDLAQFVEKMTQGRGYLAIAAVILGGWRSTGVLAAAFFFGALETASEWLAVAYPSAPHQLFLMLPYASCFGVLWLRPGLGRKPPSGLGNR
jgi:simple sugar transport system permease protein